LEAVAVGVDLSAGVACDKCGKKAILRVALTKLRPQIEMHLKLPAGWEASSLEDSGDLYITCPTCPPLLVTVPPPSVAEMYSGESRPKIEYKGSWLKSCLNLSLGTLSFLFRPCDGS